jgi:plasmid stabilization system protein ParE
VYLLNFPKIIHEDVESCYKYIKETLDAPRAAEKLIEELISKLNYLKENPYIKSLVQDSYLASLGVRSIKVKNYVVYYDINENRNTINIIRFLYNKRDWIKILKETPIEE